MVRYKNQERYIQSCEDSKYVIYIVWIYYQLQIKILLNVIQYDPHNRNNASDYTKAECLRMQVIVCHLHENRVTILLTLIDLMENKLIDWENEVLMKPQNRVQCLINGHYLWVHFHL